MDHTLIETQARHQIAERIARSSAPRIADVPRRHRVAAGLRRFADRLDH